MFNPSKFVVSASKPLPVVLLLDISSSMNEVVDPENVKRTGEIFESDGKEWEVVQGGTSKIKILNDCLKQMLDAFAKECNLDSEIWLSIITFGSEAQKSIPFLSASKIKCEDLVANGSTAMGAALKIAKNMIESKEETPSRAYRPTVVLVSDGEPNDDWEKPMQDFIKDGRSSKCDRMAIAIGAGAHEDVLREFIEGTGNPLFTSTNASDLVKFFKKVTMSVTTRKNSKNPNLLTGPIGSSKSTIVIEEKPDSERFF